MAFLTPIHLGKKIWNPPYVCDKMVVIISCPVLFIEMSVWSAKWLERGFLYQVNESRECQPKVNLRAARCETFLNDFPPPWSIVFWWKIVSMNSHGWRLTVGQFSFYFSRLRFRGRRSSSFFIYTVIKKIYLHIYTQKDEEICFVQNFNSKNSIISSSTSLNLRITVTSTLYINIDRRINTHIFIWDLTLMTVEDL